MGQAESKGISNPIYKSDLPIPDKNRQSTESFKELHIDSSELASSTKYNLARSDLSVVVSRDTVTQLISVKLISDNTHNRVEQTLGRWSITAYQNRRETIEYDDFKINVISSPFYFKITFSTSSLGFIKEIASISIKPGVLRPGDIPVQLKGPWLTHAGVQYDGGNLTLNSIWILNRYRFDNTNFEVAIGRNKLNDEVLFRFLVKDEKGVSREVSRWVLPDSEVRDAEIKLGQFLINSYVDQDSFTLKISDKSISLFPVEVGCVEVDLRNLKAISSSKIPIYISGAWQERGVNFDRHFNI